MGAHSFFHAHDLAMNAVRLLRAARSHGVANLIMGLIIALILSGPNAISVVMIDEHIQYD